MLSLRSPRRSPLLQVVARVVVLTLVTMMVPLEAGASIPARTEKLTKSAFGELLAHTGSDPQPNAFTGEPLEPNSGFQYHRARWMDPRAGRFIGMDSFEGATSDPPSLHRYLYGVADPVNRVDPTGQFSIATMNAVSGILTTVNAISQIQTAWILGQTIGKGIAALLDDEEDDLEAAADQMRQLGASAALNLLLNFGALKAGAFVVRKLGVLGILKRFQVNIINGRLAEHYIANANGLTRNHRLIPGTSRTPDIFGGIFGSGKALHEVKNVQRLSWSRFSGQLSAYAQFASQEGMKMVVHIRPGTTVDPKVVQNLNRLMGSSWKIVQDVPQSLRAVF